MKKLLISLLVVGLAAGAVTVQAAPATDNDKPLAGLFLYTKDQTLWTIDYDGPWGKVNYTEFGFVFNGHGLAAGTSYTLIMYPDPWPGNGLECLGAAVASKAGKVKIKGTNDILFEFLGEKIWLALSSDVDCAGQKMIGWHGQDYLFEHNLVGGGP